VIKEDANEPSQKSWQPAVTKRNADKIETLRFIDFPSRLAGRLLAVVGYGVFIWQAVLTVA